MTFLYGDSTPSPLEINYVDFLRKALQACVEVLLAEHDVERNASRRAALEREVDEHLTGLDELEVAVHGALDPISRSPAETPVTRCANAVERAVANTVRDHAERLRARLAADLESIAGESQRRRGAGQAAIEGLLMQYDLPDTAVTVRVDLAGEARAAILEGACPYAVQSRIELGIPADSPLSGEVRAGRFAQELIIHVPGTGGWLRKQPRSLAVDLSKHFLIEVVAAPEHTSCKLRAASAADGPGYDLAVDGAGSVQVVAVGGDEPASVELPEADAELIRALASGLRIAALELTDQRRSLLELSIDGEPFVSHPEPSALVERVVEAMAPVVLEIARRSVSPTELVLRRKLGDDRREEIYVSKAALRETLAQLPSSRRRLFDSLGLGGARPPTFELEPDMIVEEQSEPSIEIVKDEAAAQKGDERTESPAE